MCVFEQVDHLAIVDLGEVVVPLADRPQPGRLLDADDLVGVVREGSHRVGCGDGDGQHDAIRAVGASDMTGSPRRRAGGDAIVDDHRDSADEIDSGSVSSEACGPALEFFALLLLDPAEVGCRGTDHTDDLVVDHPHAVLADRPHRQFGLARNADLAHDDHVEWRVQCAGDLVGDRDTSSRQCEHHRSGAAEVLELRGERFACVAAVSKRPCHGGLLEMVVRRDHPTLVPSGTRVLRHIGSSVVSDGGASTATRNSEPIVNGRRSHVDNRSSATRPTCATSSKNSSNG